MRQPRWMHFVKEVTGLKGFKTKTIKRTPRGTMARSVLFYQASNLQVSRRGQEHRICRLSIEKIKVYDPMNIITLC